MKSLVRFLGILFFVLFAGYSIDAYCGVSDNVWRRAITTMSCFVLSAFIWMWFEEK